MTFNSNEKGNKKYYEEIMYISSNYYIFKKNPKTKVHSLTKVFTLYLILIFILFISFLFIPKLYAISVVAFLLLIIYIYLLVEAKYKLREYMKQQNSIIKIDETGIENTHKNMTSTKLYWDAIEHIIINKNTISVLPKNFSHSAIFIEIHSKEETLKALKKYNKLHLLTDNSNKY